MDFDGGSYEEIDRSGSDTFPRLQFLSKSDRPSISNGGFRFVGKPGQDVSELPAFPDAFYMPDGSPAVADQSAELIPITASGFYRLQSVYEGGVTKMPLPLEPSNPANNKLGTVSINSKMKEQFPDADAAFMLLCFLRADPNVAKLAQELSDMKFSKMSAEERVAALPLLTKPAVTAIRFTGNPAAHIGIKVLDIWKWAAQAWWKDFCKTNPNGDPKRKMPRFALWQKLTAGPQFKNKNAGTYSAVTADWTTVYPGTTDARGKKVPGTFGSWIESMKIGTEYGEQVDASKMLPALTAMHDAGSLKLEFVGANMFAYLEMVRRELDESMLTTIGILNEAPAVVQRIEKIAKLLPGTVQLLLPSAATIITDIDKL